MDKKEIERESLWLTAILFGQTTAVLGYSVFPEIAGNVWVPAIACGLTIASFIRWQIWKWEIFKLENGNGKE
jgi:hypothetical protein